MNFFAASILLLSTVYHTQAKQLSMAECLNLAQSQSLKNVQSSLSLNLAGAARTEVKAGRLPVLSAVGTYEKSDDIATQLPDANKAVLRLEQNSLPFTSSWIRAQQKQAEYQAAEYAHLESRFDIHLIVKQLYFSVLKDQDAIQSLKKVENQLEQLLNSLLPRYSIGRTPSFDLIKIKTSLSDLQRLHELTEAQLESERTQLLQILRLDTNDTYSFKNISELPTLILEDSSNGQINSNPSLQVLNEQFHAAEIGLSMAKANRYPTFITAFEYGYAGQTSNDMTRGWTFSLGLKLPLFDWGVVSSQISQESVNIQLAHLKFEVEKQKTFSDLIAAQQMAKAHLSDRNRLKLLIPEIQRASQISVDRYKKGAVGILEASDAINLWIQTLLNERSAFYNFLGDLAKIDRLKGTSEYEKL